MKMASIADATVLDSDVTERAYAKVTWRLIPLLFLCGIVAYLDRVNVGFAKIQMLEDLRFSEAVYGLGAGIFFLGYFLFEVPSNLILYRTGPRVWIARIIITWGVLSSSMMFVTTPEAFYIMRFMLGAAEAGFFPGMILYLTYWFPSERRGKVLALFLTAVPVSGVIGGPLSGWILQAFKGVYGLAGWQWLFLIEGLPSVVLGFVVLRCMCDSIGDAHWLNATEKRLLIGNIEKETATKSKNSFRDAICTGRVWLLCAIYFCVMMGVSGVLFWLPSIIKATGVADPLRLGLLTAVPYCAATIGMVLFGRSADRRRERRWHVAIPCVLGAAGLVLSVVVGGSTSAAIWSLSLATLGVISAVSVFWACPTAFLSGTAAAGGIALINSIGNLAGFISPYMIGVVKETTQSTNVAVCVISCFLVFGAFLMLLFVPARLVNK